MSGGVDSSLSAVLLKKAGWDVIGMTIKFGQPYKCCQDASDASDIAKRFGFKHYVLNMENDFDRMIIEPFCREFTIGRTPNPCIICNQELKFKLALRRAVMLGCDCIASGHYARNIGPGDDNRGECKEFIKKFPEAEDCFLLGKAHDNAKDQTYFLFSLKQDQLKAIRFPLGHLTKPEVRELAREYGLHVAEKAESQDICFTNGNNYIDLVKEKFPESIVKGDILDSEGKKLGEHHGIANYTIGQRHGLNIAVGRPIYVTKISPEDNTITVGDDDKLMSDRLLAENCSWTFTDRLNREIDAEAKIRYRNESVPCHVKPMGGYEVVVTFDKPRRAITPGQAVVFYEGDFVIGGGWIARD